MNKYIKNADFVTIFALAKPYLEKQVVLTDKAEKASEALQTYKMKSVDEIVPLTDLFFADFPELTGAEREVMAGRNGTDRVDSLQKESWKLCHDADFVTENIFHQSRL